MKTKLKLTVELTYNAEVMHGSDEGAKEWFFQDILLHEPLLLHSNEIGDTIGTLKVLKIVGDKKCDQCNGTGHTSYFDGSLEPDRYGFTTFLFCLDLTAIIKHCEVCGGSGKV